MDALKALQAAVATQSGMSGICAASPAIRAADFCSCSAALHHLSCCRTGRWLHADHCALTHHSCFEVPLTPLISFPPHHPYRWATSTPTRMEWTMCLWTTPATMPSQVS